MIPAMRSDDSSVAERRRYRAPGWPAAARQIMIRAALLAVVLLLLGAPSWAGEPPQAPLLRIEAGGHIGAVPKLAVDAAGSLMASASYDKTVRLWSLPEGTPRGVLRPPVGPGQEGELYAVALTPDGRRAFVAGATGGSWDGSFSIYVYDTAKQSLIGLLGGLPSPVYDLAVSPDGRFFAAGLAQGGVRVWEAATGKPVYEDRAYAGPVRGVVMDGQGRLYAAGADGRVRLYDPAGRKLADAAPPGGLRPWGLALSPDGFLLAVTSETADKQGRMRVDVLNARSLVPVFAPDTSGLAGEGLLTVSWAADDRGGVQLLAGGYAHGAAGYVIRRWGDYGLGGFTDLPAANDTIRSIVAVPGGGAVFSSEDPGWGRLAPDGRTLRRPAPPMADMRPARDKRLALSPDGAVVEFATRTGLERFSLASRSLAPAATPDNSLAAARTSAPGLALDGWRDTNAPRLNNQKLALEPGEFARSVAISPDNAAILLGTDTHLRLFGKDGNQIAAVDTPTPAWAVAIASSGKVALAALLDGSVRWYGLTPDAMLAERAALFAHADGQRWVLFTPEGFFDHADRGGNDLVGVQLNRARNQQPEWVSLSQAYRVLYAPAVVRARLLGDPAPATARLAELGDLRARMARQPLAEIAGLCAVREDGACAKLDLKPGQPATLPEGAAHVRLDVKVTERGLGIGPLDSFVNDRNAGRSAPPAPGAITTVDLPVDPGPNTIQLRVYDKAGTVFTETPPITLLPTGPPVAAGRGRLFVLAVGIDTYANPSLKLNYAVADAQTFTDMVRARASGLFRSVDITFLKDSEASKAGILAAFDRLGKEIRPSDTFLFYVASHGVRDDDGRFMLIPADLSDISSYQAMGRQAIDESTLVGALSRIEARDALLFLDTCHSGQVTADNLANVGHETGRYLLAASSSVQEALDSYDNRNGVFVYAMKEAVTGRAGQDADGNLGALALGEYVSRRVGQLAREKGHEQDAVFRAAQRDLRSFPVVHVRK